MAVTLRLEDPRFVASGTSPDNFPPPTYPEIAFAGRSNVGKSSLLNTLLGRPLARTSSTPGRTRLERALGKPVLTTNMVSIWGALRMLGHREPIAGYGALLREHFHTQEA